MSKMKKEIYLDELPRWENGLHKGKTNWKSSVGYEVKGIYDDINFKVKIMDYDGQNLHIKYKDKELKIYTGNFQRCLIGKLFDKRTVEFKIEVGRVFKDNKRDITIINREYRKRKHKSGAIENEKWYEYHCNKCGHEGWIIESAILKQNVGCSICHAVFTKAVLGINTIWDTDRWMYDLGVSEEDAKTHTRCSADKIKPICPDCGRIKKKAINIYHIYKDHSIGCSCGKGQSYPNKLMFNILEQLKIEFETEYSPDWIKPKRYDFCFEINKNSKNNYIVEMDGNLGHGNKDNSMNGQTAEESKKIDNYKDKVADEHGVKVIRIDCKKSNLEFIKNNILDSELNELFDLSKIDWLQAEKFALLNLAKKACDYKKGNSNMSTENIGNIMKLSRDTIRKYLKQGTKLGWCNYDPKEEKRKGALKTSILRKKSVEMFKNNKSLGKFDSSKDLEKESEELFGIKLSSSCISSVCRGTQKQHKGFTFRYILTRNMN